MIGPKKLMRMRIIWVVLVCLCAASPCIRAQTEPADYVDPWIESARSRYFYFNSACRPFGMINLSPDTVLKGAWGAGYRYQVPFVRGLTHIRAWEVGGLLVMPTTGGVDPTGGPEAWKSGFTHDGEIVQPGYHKLHLDKYDIGVELTSTTRVGFHRYTFDKAGQADILVWLGGQLGGGIMVDARIERTTDREITGWVVQGRPENGPKLHFVIQFDKAPASWHAWRGDRNLGPLDKGVEGRDSGVTARFDVRAGDQLLVKAGVSWCSIEQARLNLNAELDHWDFDRVRQESREQWNRWLGRIEVKGGTRDQRVKFYTDLWHALLGRRQIQDVNGRYPNRMSGTRQVGQLPLDDKGQPKFMHLNTDAWWMTMWNLNILWGLAWPQVMEDAVNSSLTYYKDGGHLPRGPIIGAYSWIMTGCANTELIVAAYMKGMDGFDTDLALEAMIKAHTQPGSTMDRYGGFIEEYIRLGYVPETKPPQAWGGPGRTMEYVTQDWALAQFAKALGRDDIHETFMKRSENWVNVFDPEIGFVRPKYADGTWKEPFDPMRDHNGGGFVEANSWQTTWMATHDVQGMVNLMGGRDAYCDKLHFAFDNSRHTNFVSPYGDGYVSYANQPGCAMAHMFNYAGKPWLAQYWVRQVNEHAYGGVTPELGYGGHDEDQGQMGGVSALMSMGLFEARGGCAMEPIYEITAPVFDEVTIHLDPKFYSGKTFRIVTHNNGPENVYIQSAKLNGESLNNCWFYHRDFAKGGTLELVLGSEPNTAWGTEELPPSETRGEPAVTTQVQTEGLPKSVKAGEAVRIDMVVTNAGETGSVAFELEASCQGQPNVKLAQKRWLLEKGQTRSLTMEGRMFYAGKTALILNGEPIATVDVQFRPGRLDLSNVDYSVLGETVRAKADVLNAGSEAVARRIDLLANGRAVGHEQVDLLPGQVQPLVIAFEPPHSGVYTFSLDGQSEKRFDFAKPPLRDEPDLALLIDLDYAPTPFCDLSGRRSHPRLPDQQAATPLAKAGTPGRFFGPGRYLSVESPAQSIRIDRGLTFCFWVNAQDWSGNTRLMQQGGDDFMILSWDGRFVFYLRGVQGGQMQTELPPTGQWVLITCRYSAAEERIEIWYDDQRVAGRKASGRPLWSRNPLYIGTKDVNAEGRDFFNGSIREVRIYETGLSEEQIKKLASRGK